MLGLIIMSVPLGIAVCLSAVAIVMAEPTAPSAVSKRMPLHASAGLSTVATRQSQ